MADKGRTAEVAKDGAGALIPVGFQKIHIDDGTSQGADVSVPLQVAVGADGKPLSDDLAELRGEIADLRAMLAGKGTAENPSVAQLSGSTLEYYVPDEADRPAANSVPVGAAVMAVNSGRVWQSNGSKWVAQ